MKEIDMIEYGWYRTDAENVLKEICGEMIVIQN